MGELGSIKPGRVGINQAWENRWDQSSVGELGSIKPGRVGINQAWENCDPINRFNSATFVFAIK